MKWIQLELEGDSNGIILIILIVMALLIMYQCFMAFETQSCYTKNIHYILCKQIEANMYVGCQSSLNQRQSGQGEWMTTMTSLWHWLWQNNAVPECANNGQVSWHSGYFSFWVWAHKYQHKNVLYDTRDFANTPK